MSKLTALTDELFCFQRNLSRTLRDSSHTLTNFDEIIRALLSV